jgi:hypothetical protein
VQNAEFRVQNEERRGALQSQRDCGSQPRVARNELPWVTRARAINPEGVAENSLIRQTLYTLLRKRLSGLKTLGVIRGKHVFFDNYT